MDSPPPALNRLKSLAPGERPEERIARDGPRVASDSELIAMLLRSGTEGNDVLTLATALVAEAGSLAGLIKWKAADFQKHKGIGKVKALQLVTVMEIAFRVRSQDRVQEPILEHPQHTVDHLLPLSHGLEVEKFWVLCLNRKNRLIKCVEVTSGTASGALAHPREVFREAIRVGASAVICAHNHPSGDPAPSSQDMAITRLLREAAKTVDIALHDHVILGRPSADPAGVGYYSFREGGYL